jgi:DNA-binding NtrC family response regulator
MNDVVPQSSRILVVDDDAGMRQMLANYLSEQNMAVASVAGRQDMAQHCRRLRNQAVHSRNRLHPSSQPGLMPHRAAQMRTQRRLTPARY